MVDHLADALNTLKTHEIAGQRDCNVRSTKIVRSVVELLKAHKYLSNFDIIDNGKGGSLTIELDGRINDCGVIRPRISVKRTEWARWEQQFIPGVGVGLLIVSTPKGIMTNRDAEAAHIGGRLLAYVY